MKLAAQNNYCSDQIFSINVTNQSKTANKNIAKYTNDSALIIQDAIEQHLLDLENFVEKESNEVKKLKEIENLLQNLDGMSKQITFFYSFKKRSFNFNFYGKC